MLATLTIHVSIGSKSNIRRLSDGQYVMQFFGHQTVVHFDLGDTAKLLSRTIDEGRLLDAPTLRGRAPTTCAMHYHSVYVPVRPSCASAART
jgi:hypothetical protein